MPSTELLSDPLEALLVEREQVTPAGLKALGPLLLQSAEPRAVMLSRSGLVDERLVADALGELLGQAPLAPADYPEVAVSDVPLTAKFLLAAMVVPIADDGQELVMAMADPRDGETRRAVELACGRRVRARLGLPSDIEQAIERCHGTQRSRMDRIVEELGSEAETPAADEIAQLRSMASEAPIVRLVNLVLERAVEARASDIHIEPFEQGLKVRFRVDGVLQEQESPPPRSAAAMVSRLKIMARMDIAERRLPQDGRIRYRRQGKELDIRVSSVPTLHGESMVLRLLDKGGVVLEFDRLGLRGPLRARLERLLRMPHGIILVSGPTGSGKTTTLYTGLELLNAPERKIITVEDPVEYQLPGINQIQVKPSIGLDFARALRSIVRQDPDVIMVGEMRDLETARIAVQAALTGHLVLSTVHTNSAAASITRLVDMGLEPYLITSTVNGILAQRLVRRLCESCRQPRELSREEIDQLGIAGQAQPGMRIYRAAGCEDCGHSGYRGRVAIAELLVMDDGLRRKVMTGADAATLEQAAVAGGMQSLFVDGIGKVLSGETTMEEVLRVSQDASSGP